MSFLKAAVVYPAAAAAFAAGCLAFLLTAGAVNCRAEEEYWGEFWDDTPVTESGQGEPTILPKPIYGRAGEETELRKAA